MAQGKTRYDFAITNPIAIQNVMNAFLSSNGFVQKNKNGTVYYEHNDAMAGKGFIEYSLTDTQLIILGYVYKFDKPYRIDNNELLMALPKNHLKGMLDVLFAEIQRVNGAPQHNTYTPNNNPQSNQYTQTVNTNMSPGQFVNNDAMNQNQATVNAFAEQQNKNRSTMAIIGFVLSILTFFGSCFGVAAGLLFYAAEYYLATQGLKSDKKGLAIATYVLATLGILITIVSIILQAAMN